MNELKKTLTKYINITSNQHKPYVSENHQLEEKIINLIESYIIQEGNLNTHYLEEKLTGILREYTEG